MGVSSSSKATALRQLQLHVPVLLVALNVPHQTTREVGVAQFVPGLKQWQSEILKESGLRLRDGGDLAVAEVRDRERASLFNVSLLEELLHNESAPFSAELEAAGGVADVGTFESHLENENKESNYKNQSFLIIV